jgi:hypothetical protein
MSLPTSEPPRDELERGLAELTRWDAPSPEVWRKALEAEEVRRGVFVLRFPRTVLAAAAMVLLAVTVGIILLPGIGSPRRSYGPVAQAPMEEYRQDMDRFAASPAPAASQPSPGYAEMEIAEATPSPSDLAAPGTLFDQRQMARRSGGRMELQQAAAEPRHIIRQVSMELRVEDVRSAFAKAQLIPSRARGEYVQASSLRGDDEHAGGELTLRIAVDRLDQALNELRTLGEVRSEQATGDDVTAQVVDLEARLRNERRIESELLELLDRRTDSALKDVMTVRQSLDEVRQRIEQLVGQREHIARSVSLATVLVIIRAAGQDEIKPAGAIMDYFQDTIASAWNRGVVFLADSVGFLVAVVVGGLVWWMMLAAAAAVVIWHRRRLLARGLV